MHSESALRYVPTPEVAFSCHAQGNDTTLSSQPGQVPFVDASRRRCPLVKLVVHSTCEPYCCANILSELIVAVLNDAKRLHRVEETQKNIYRHIPSPVSRLSNYVPLCLSGAKCMDYVSYVCVWVCILVQILFGTHPCGWGAHLGFGNAMRQFVLPLGDAVCSRDKYVWYWPKQIKDQGECASAPGGLWKSQVVCGSKPPENVCDVAVSTQTIAFDCTYGWLLNLWWKTTEGVATRLWTEF